MSKIIKTKNIGSKEELNEITKYYTKKANKVRKIPPNSKGIEKKQQHFKSKNKFTITLAKKV